MPEVQLSTTLQDAVGGVTHVNVDAANIRELLRKLVERYPAMQRHVDEGVAVSINGEIYRDNWGEVIPPNAEIFLLPRIQGG